MRASILAGLLSAVSLVAAAPGSHLFERQSCPGNNCNNAINKQSNPKAACSSALLVTVSSCGGTATATSTVTNTAATVTVTQTSTVPTTTGVVATSSSATTTTVSTASGVTVVTTTVKATVTVTVSSTTSVTAVPTGPGGPQKVKRATCTPSTTGGSSLPAFAANCNSFAKFSSGCSACQGVTASTTTIGAGAPTTTTVTTTTTSTPTTTVTSTTRPVFSSTSTSTVTTTVTVTVVGSATATSTTTTSSGTTTTTTTVVQTIAPTSGTFALVVQGGRKLGVNADGTLQPKSSGTTATFSLTTTGQLTSGGLIFGVQSPGGSNDLIVGKASATGAGFVPLSCSLSNPPSSGALVCTAGSEKYYEIKLDSNGGSTGNLYLSATSYQSGFAQTDLQAVSP